MLLCLEQRLETPWLFVLLIAEANYAHWSPLFVTSTADKCLGLGFIHKIFSYRHRKTRSGVCKEQIICKYLLFLSLK